MQVIVANLQVSIQISLLNVILMALVETVYNCKVHPNRLVIWPENVYDSPRVRNVVVDADSDGNIYKSNSGNLKRNLHKNKMSKTSVSKCKRAIDYLLLTATNKSNSAIINWKDVKFRIAFITLTLPAVQVHSDNEIKRECLNQFLINAKRLWDVEKYVWRAERQVNGNIHFHIIVDKFIPWHEIRGLWNRLIGKLGYLDIYRKNMQAFHKDGFKVRKDLLDKWSYTNQLKAYKQGVADRWSNPNSTDIHSVRFINNVGAYVTKYMTKNETLRNYKVCARGLGYTMKYIKGSHSLSFNTLKYLRNKAQIGKLWSCSMQLSNIKGGEDIVDSTLSAEITRIKNNPRAKCYDDGYCQVINVPIQVAIDLHCFRIVNLLSEFVTGKFILNTS
jgi:hypothetical protein